MSLLRKCLLNKNTLRIITRPKHGGPTQKPTKIMTQTLQYHSTHKNNIFKAFVLVCSSYLTYKVVKGRFSLVPQVNAASKSDTNNLAGRRQQFNFIAEVVEKSAPAVVYIEIKDTRRTDFFTGKPTTLSNGSGFIIEAEGLIVTNAHVVTNRPNARVEVKLMDGRTFIGVVENVDFRSDLALVRIAASNLPIMKLGSSADLMPGEFVVAIGSPLALSNTVTTGVISSTQRGADELGLRDRDMVYIQTDAAITFGNSGGPLVNLDGEAIGVNSMKIVPGISFAIPIDYVKAFLKDSKAKGPNKQSGSTKRLYMGITMFTLTPQLAHEFAQKHGNVMPHNFSGGVLVWKVVPESPAYIGGLQPGDIVTAIDGKQIRSAQDVYDILKNGTAKVLRMSVQRKSEQFEIKVHPEALG
ncbi:unnamed protein product [Ceutorhynchus assimilis]|uniref:Serine protease HTRA2, mitochondrial n=1 Tax=Ceutorhynchus assimilis TaxID=467358 RepID=A0A9N9MU94_9CUCU|nr:unnamed protein product [Ceutorhynchus assimilis]